MLKAHRWLKTSTFCAALGLSAMAALAATTTNGNIRTVIIQETGVWVEGPGFSVTYGGDYQGCAQKCLGHERCVMLEYYKPEKKCNLYDRMRPRKAGGSSLVGIRRLQLVESSTR